MAKMKDREHTMTREASSGGTRQKKREKNRNLALLKMLPPSSNCEILARVSGGLCPDMILVAIPIKQLDE